MKPSERQRVFDKFNGKCAYCGTELQKGWCVDHIEPIGHIPPEYQQGSKFMKPHLDNFENMNPSCASCNNYKSSMELETFRSEIEEQIERLRKTKPTFRLAERYGLIKCEPKNIKFYFEL